jgi:hypothetical protein
MGDDITPTGHKKLESYGHASQLLDKVTAEMEISTSRQQKTHLRPTLS